MIGVVLCGGKGTRMRPLIGDAQKCLLPVAGRAILHRVLDHLVTCDRILLAVDHQADDVMHETGFPWRGTPLDYVQTTGHVGTAASIRRALEELARMGSPPQPLLATNGDSILPAAATYTSVPFHPALSGLAVVAAAERRDKGAVEHDETAEIVTGFFEKTARGPGLVSAGLYYLHPVDFPQLGAGDSLERDVLPALAKARRLSSRLIRGPILDVGTIEGYYDANDYYTGKK